MSCKAKRVRANRINSKAKRVILYILLGCGIWYQMTDATDESMAKIQTAATQASIDPCAPIPNEIFNPCADITPTTIDDRRHDGTPVLFKWEDKSVTVCIHKDCYSYTDDYRGKMIGQSTTTIGANLS